MPGLIPGGGDFRRLWDPRHQRTVAHKASHSFAVRAINCGCQIEPRKICSPAAVNRQKSARAVLLIQIAKDNLPADGAPRKSHERSDRSPDALSNPERRDRPQRTDQRHRATTAARREVVGSSSPGPAKLIEPPCRQ